MAPNRLPDHLEEISHDWEEEQRIKRALRRWLGIFFALLLFFIWFVIAWIGGNK